MSDIWIYVLVFGGILVSCGFTLILWLDIHKTIKLRIEKTYDQTVDDLISESDNIRATIEFVKSDVRSTNSRIDCEITARKDNDILTDNRLDALESRIDSCEQDDKGTVKLIADLGEITNGLSNDFTALKKDISDWKLYTDGRSVSRPKSKCAFCGKVLTGAFEAPLIISGKVLNYDDGREVYACERCRDKFDALLAERRSNETAE